MRDFYVLKNAAQAENSAASEDQVNLKYDTPASNIPIS